MNTTPNSAPNLPAPPASIQDPTTRNYLSYLVKALVTELASRLSLRSAAPFILLASPNGSVYTVKVADDGSLVTELVYDAS